MVGRPKVRKKAEFGGMVSEDETKEEWKIYVCTVCVFWAFGDGCFDSP